MNLISNDFLRGSCLVAAVLASAMSYSEVPVHVEPFSQQVHHAYGADTGLPHDSIARIGTGDDGAVYVRAEGEAVFRLDDGRWVPLESGADDGGAFDDVPWVLSVSGVGEHVRDVAQRGDEVAVAKKSGLYLQNHDDWAMVLATDGDIRWAPIDVRAVVYDDEGHLWFASPQGVGRRDEGDAWTLYTGADGLPFNDFTCMAAGSSGIWLGTTNGAIQFHEGKWHFRQGRRWLVNDHVVDIAIDDKGDAWIATKGGVSHIGHEAMTLAGKATYYESEIEKYHRRTKFGYVNPATLEVAGDRSTARARYSDNDGFNTGLFLGAMSFAYAATGDAKYRDYAHQSFRALAFLSEVTQGGEFGGPKGLIARNVVPTTEPDPNDIYSEDYDIRRNERDKLWKILERRVPTDKTGEWYWKADASSDELDGHFFGSAIYFDRVCKTKEEKDAVREVVRRLIDHLIRHDYNIVDYDGKPTRWGHFSPEDLNENPEWHSERGLNSYSILTYLSIAHHILGDKKYRREYMKLAIDHGYGMNGMTQPKELPGPNYPGHQPDDNMAFMNYYHLIRYETDPKLLSMFQYAIRDHWKYEQLERNAFTNFIYGACARGKSRTDQWRTIDLSPPLACYEDAIDTLMRYPMDLIEWPMSNAHRIDLVPMGEHGDGAPTMGGRVDGYAYPIDERHETYWDWDPWRLTSRGDGTTLRAGFHYLVAYYMGLYHGFIEE